MGSAYTIQLAGNDGSTFKGTPDQAWELLKEAALSFTLPKNFWQVEDQSIRFNAPHMEEGEDRADYINGMLTMMKDFGIREDRQEIWLVRSADGGIKACICRAIISLIMHEMYKQGIEISVIA